MTIKPGEEWGRPAGDVAPAVHATGDAGLARLLAKGATGPVALGGGDLHRAVGAPAPGASGILLPVDLLEVTIDDDPPDLAVAHVVVRRPGPAGWWLGPLLAVCNVDYVGEWNIAPRAHPNDGRADVVEVSAMAVRARWQARRRMPHGTHLPHPAIKTRSVRSATWEFDQPLCVWLDGERRGTARTLTVEVRPDAFELLV